ncbi:MAG: hypothetical protein ACJAQ6_000038 [Arenicella sp.]|jgi:hypothetical protein
MKKMIQACFLDHPESVGESYFQHLIAASGFAVRLVWAGLACFMHGVFPFLCVKTGSGIINQLHDSMLTHRGQIATDQPKSSEA